MINIKDENMIALSAEFHTHPRYSEYYRKTARGVCSIYDTIQQMGVMLTAWEEQNPEAWTETHDWLAVTECFADEFIAAALDAAENMTAALQRALERSKISEPERGAP